MEGLSRGEGCGQQERGAVQCVRWGEAWQARREQREELRMMQRRGLLQLRRQQLLQQGGAARHAPAILGVTSAHLPYLGASASNLPY
jgi:hypothetical protein